MESSRFLRPDVALARMRAHLQSAIGEGEARATWVLVKENGTWQVASFQNTPIQPTEGRGGPPPSATE